MHDQFVITSKYQAIGLTNDLAINSIQLGGATFSLKRNRLTTKPSVLQDLQGTKKA